jgi:hypothetical protein
MFVHQFRQPQLLVQNSRRFFKLPSFMTWFARYSKHGKSILPPFGKIEHVHIE